jgi:uncharacterized membrane protein YccC
MCEIKNCRNNSLKDMAVCIEHLDKDAIHLMVNDFIARIENLEFQQERLWQHIYDLWTKLEIGDKI